MNDIFVQKVKTSYGVYNRFLKKVNNGEYAFLSLFPYEKISSSEFLIKPDCTKTGRIISIENENELEHYDENKKYINIFKQ